MSTKMEGTCKGGEGSKWAAKEMRAYWNCNKRLSSEAGRGRKNASSRKEGYQKYKEEPLRSEATKAQSDKGATPLRDRVPKALRRKAATQQNRKA